MKDLAVLMRIPGSLRKDSKASNAAPSASAGPAMETPSTYAKTKPIFRTAAAAFKAGDKVFDFLWAVRQEREVGRGRQDLNGDRRKHSYRKL